MNININLMLANPCKKPLNYFCSAHRKVANAYLYFLFQTLFTSYGELFPSLAVSFIFIYNYCATAYLLLTLCT